MITEKNKKYTAIFSKYTCPTDVSYSDLRKYTTDDFVEIYLNLKKHTTANFVDVRNEANVLIAKSISIPFTEPGIEALIGKFVIGQKVTFAATIVVDSENADNGFHFTDVRFDWFK